jgi:hypothetical protein
MHLNITNSETGDNKGSSGQLVHYLDKEARTDQSREPESWFNAAGKGYQSYTVRNSLDKNIAKLGKDDAKFYLINISPSQKEIAHLKEVYGDQQAEEQLRAYAIKVMDEYARNFKRPGINSNKDLLWYGKLEHHRYSSHKDQEVSQTRRPQIWRTIARPGHCQPQGLTNKIKLSPENTSRGKNIAHSKKMGQFDRVAFKNSGERVFDELFDFNRPITDTFRYANTQVNGTLAERMAMDAEKTKEKLTGKTELNQKDQILSSPDQSIENHLNETTSILDILLAKADFDPAAPVRRKKKRKKTVQSSQQLNQ